jgi:hypothetical protein
MSHGRDSTTSRRRSWTPHLWVLVPPVAAVLIGYGLWFALLAVLRAPDWLARLFPAQR